MLCQEWVNMKEQTRGSAREVRRNGARELEGLVVGIVWDQVICVPC